MIPAFSAAGVIPPFVGDPAATGQRSPYRVSAVEVIGTFATSARRCDILQGWLKHRAALHSLGIVDGFQWLDGSFCEQLSSREPNDIDLVTFFSCSPNTDVRVLGCEQPGCVFYAFRESELSLRRVFRSASQRALRGARRRELLVLAVFSPSRLWPLFTILMR
jgi:hypothetical protein